MKESVVKGRVQRPFDRATQQYRRETVKRENRIVYQTTELIKKGNLKEAVDGLIRNRDQFQKDAEYQQQISFHIALLYYRMGCFDQATLQLLKLIDRKEGVSDQMFCRAVTTTLVIFVRTGDYKKAEQTLRELQKHLKTMYGQSKRRPPKLRVQAVRECSIKLIGLQSLSDCALISSEPSRNGHEDQVKAIYKMIAEEFEQAKFHMVKALKYWRELNHESECLVCLYFILVFNGKLGKPQQKYMNEVSRLEARLNMRGDLKAFQQRLNFVIKILSQLQEQLSSEEKLLLLQRNHPIEATRIAICYRLRECITKIVKERDNVRLQLGKLTKKSDPQHKQELERQLQCYTESRDHLQQFLQALIKPSQNDVVYLLSKYKQAGEAYQSLRRKVIGFMGKYANTVKLLAFRRMVKFAERVEPPVI